MGGEKCEERKQGGFMNRGQRWRQSEGERGAVWDVGSALQEDLTFNVWAPDRGTSSCRRARRTELRGWSR